MGRDFLFQAEDGIRDSPVTGVQTCALPILEFLELLIAEGDRITIGINASKENKNAILEVLFEAKASGKWAKALKKIDSRPSYFAPLIDEKAPLSFSLSWKMDKREQDNTTDFLRILEPQIAAQLEPVAPAVHNLFAALNKTAVTGHADAFFQYKVVPPEQIGRASCRERV